MGAVRVICCRLGDPHRHPLRRDTDLRECCRCGYPIWVNGASIAYAMLRVGGACELWCLECNHVDQSPKVWITMDEGNSDEPKEPERR